MSAVLHLLDLAADGIVLGFTACIGVRVYLVLDTWVETRGGAGT